MANTLATAISTWAEPRLAKANINMVTALVALLTAIGLGTGVYSFIVGHQHLYGVTREVPWGILISTYAFFAITSTGLVLIAAISHMFGGTAFAPLANRAVYLSIITIFSAFATIGVELESPWRMLIYNVISPNLTSNIWWMGTLYGLAVGCMLVEFVGILTKNWRLALTIGVIGALAEVGANTNLGAVFATLTSRPFWYGSQLPVFFLCSAFASGAAVIILFSHLGAKMRGTEMSEGSFKALQSAGKVLALTIFLLAVAITWRMISFFVGGTQLGQLAALNLLKGPMAVNFWVFEIIIGLVLPFVILVGTQMKNPAAMSTAALMYLVGGFINRFDIVTAGQQVPVYYGWDNLPSYMGYFPSAGELMVVVGAISLTVLGFLLGERFFGKVFTSGHH